MKFLANENIPISSVTYLQSLGYDIKAIGIDNPNVADEHIMEIAFEENRTVLTYDSDLKATEKVINLPYQSPI